MKIKLDKGAFAPERAHTTDAGYDLRTPHAFYLPKGQSVVIDTGVHIQLPHGTVGMIKSKSGLNVKYGITSEGVVDEGYTGSIRAKLYNHGVEGKRFDAGDKITQLCILPYLAPDIEIADELDPSDRSDNGFGSTGI